MGDEKVARCNLALLAHADLALPLVLTDLPKRAAVNPFVAPSPNAHTTTSCLLRAVQLVVDE